LDSFKNAVSLIIKPQNASNIDISLPMSGQAAGVPQEKTLKEILEEREVELKELEQLETIQDTAYMDALAEDLTNENKPTEQ
jgi:hypothetical protein